MIDRPGGGGVAGCGEASGSAGWAVSAVVVTFHSERFIADCLDSLSRQTARPRKIIVVDNGSADGTCSIVRDRFPAVHLIELESNTGFCRANNIGLAASVGDFVLFANPDTILEPNYLMEALKEFDADPKVGMVSGKLLRFDRVTIDSAGQVLTRGRKILDRGFGEKDAGQFQARAAVDSVCGAMALYRRKMVDDISESGRLFDEEFFAFWEDMDVAWRAKRSGWKAVYTPSAVARHFRGGSQRGHSFWTHLVRMGGRPPEIRYHIVKNQWLMILKNDTPLNFALHLPFILPRAFAVLGYLLISSPSEFFRLFYSPGCFLRAWRRRRAVS